MPTLTQNTSTFIMSGLEQHTAASANANFEQQNSIENVWESLSAQVSSSNKKIAIAISAFDAMSLSERVYLADQLMHQIRESVLYVRDSSQVRILLGANSCWNDSQLIPVAGEPHLLVGSVENEPNLLARSVDNGVLRAKVIRRKKTDKIPRPCNAFILYRKHWHETVKAQNPGLHNNQISKIIGSRWQSEENHVRANWKATADIKAQEHALLHPDYQYKPRKPSERKKRMTKAKAAALADKSAQIMESLSLHVPGTVIADLPSVATYPGQYGGSFAASTMSNVQSAEVYANAQEADLNDLPWDYLTADYQETSAIPDLGEDFVGRLDFNNLSSLMDDNNVTLDSNATPQETVSPGAYLLY